MSDDLPEDRDIVFTPQGRRDFEVAGESVQREVVQLLGFRAPDRIDAKRLREFPNWLIARTSYLDVMFRWLTPDEVRADGRAPGSEVAFVHRVAELPYRERAFSIPGSAAVVGAALGVLLAPEHMDQMRYRQAFGGFFGTSAQVIATLLVALAIEARHIELRNRFGLVTLGYVASGLVASVAAASPSLAPWMYRGLLAVALAGGLGALASVLLVAHWGLERRKRRIAPPRSHEPSDSS